GRAALREQPQNRLLVAGQLHPGSEPYGAEATWWMLAVRGRESLISASLGLAAMADDLRGLVSHFDELIGTEWLDDDPDHARVRVELRDDLRQPLGLMHGG